MKHDEIQTSEIREKKPGFDRRDRTVRGYCGYLVEPGYELLVCVPMMLGGRECEVELTANAGERIRPGDLVEMENGLWWVATPAARP